MNSSALQPGLDEDGDQRPGRLKPHIRLWQELKKGEIDFAATALDENSEHTRTCKMVLYFSKICYTLFFSGDIVKSKKKYMSFWIVHCILINVLLCLLNKLTGVQNGRYAVIMWGCLRVIFVLWPLQRISGRELPSVAWATLAASERAAESATRRSRRATWGPSEYVTRGEARWPKSATSRPLSVTVNMRHKGRRQNRSLTHEGRGEARWPKNEI